MRTIVGRAQLWLLAAALLAALSSFAGTPAKAADQVVTGLNVIEIFYSRDGKTIDGGFRTFGGSQWQQNGPDGNLVHSFTELSREQWLVTLYDATRDVYFYLDVDNRQVSVALGTAHLPARYSWIVWSQAGNVQHAVTGWNANAVNVPGDGETVTARFLHQGHGERIQINKQRELIQQHVE